MEITHALIAVIYGSNEMDILHFCGFDHKPTEEDQAALAHRLSTDHQYGLVGETYQIQEAPSVFIRHYKELNPKDNDAYYVDWSGLVVKMT